MKIKKHFQMKELFILATKVLDIKNIQPKDLIHIYKTKSNKLAYKSGNRDIITNIDWEYGDNELFIRFKLCLLEIISKEHYEEVLEYLSKESYDTSNTNLVLIFKIILKIIKKNNIFNEKIVKKCLKYFQVKCLKTFISQIIEIYCLLNIEEVTKIINYDKMVEMNLWSKEMFINESAESKKLLRMLFNTLNQKAFRQSKKVLLSLNPKLYNNLPDSFTSQGYKHLRELFKETEKDKLIEIQKNLREDSPVILFVAENISNLSKWCCHEEVEIRIEVFRHIKKISDLKFFFNFNQFIYESSCCNTIIKLFKSLLMSSSQKSDFLEIYDGYIIKMIKSRNPARRFLGVSLMEIFINLGLVKTPECNDLLFDKHYEVRNVALKIAKKIKLTDTYLLKKIQSLEYYDIYGATEYSIINQKNGLIDLAYKILKNQSNAYLEEDNEKIFKNSVFGILHLLAASKKHNITNEVNAIYRYCFNKLSNAVYDEEEENMDIKEIALWRNLRECCNYYCVVALETKDNRFIENLIFTLLYINHLGTILAISEYLSLIFEKLIFSEEELKIWIDNCFKRAKSCELNFRKSGGISVLFITILKNRQNSVAISKYIMDKLFTYLLEDDENFNLHCLNILNKLVENDRMVENATKYVTKLFEISLDCCRSNIWSIKNVGIKICTNLIIRLFGRDVKMIDDHFNVHNGLREVFYNQLHISYEKNDEFGLYFALILYERIEFLNSNERILIENSIKKRGMVGLKASNILNRKLKCRIGSKPNIDIQIKFDPALEDWDIKARLLLLLDSDDADERLMASAYIMKNFGVSNYSVEYYKHWIVEKVKNSKNVEKFKSKLNEFNASVMSSSVQMFSNTYSNEYFDLEYILDILE